MKRLYQLIISLLSVGIGLVGCGKETPLDSNISLSKTELTLSVGESEILTATVSGNATDLTITWRSNAINIATVDNNGKIVAISEGSAIITAKAGAVSATCSVTVVSNGSVTPGGSTVQDFIIPSYEGAIVSLPGKTCEVLIQSSGVWSLEGSSPYIQVSKTKGYSGDKIVFSPTKELLLNQSQGFKTESFTLRCGSASYLLNISRAQDSFSVGISRAEGKYKSYYYDYGIIDYGSDYANIPGNGGQLSIVRVASTLPYTIVMDNNLATIESETSILNSDSYKAYYDYYVQKEYSFSVKPNEDTTEATPYRSFRIRFEYEGTTLGSLTINQEGQPKDGIISFKDPYAKEALLYLFDENDDGNLSYREAANVIRIRGEGNRNVLFDYAKVVTCLDELQYFIRVKEIYGAFAGSTSLKSVVLPPNLIYLPWGFQGCSSLESVILPEGLESIGTGAFGECTSLVSISIPNSVNEIGESAFSGSGLQSIQLPGNIKGLKRFAFHYCRNLQSVILNEGLETIEDSAFALCPFEQMTIPSTVENIGNNVIQYCNNLRVIKGKYASSDGRCLIYKGFKLLAMAPAGLKSYSIPEGVVEIEMLTEFEDGFKSLYIPSSCTSIAGTRIIGQNTIIYCKPLTPPTKTNNEAFGGYCKIYVPSSSLQDYKLKWADTADLIFGYDF